MRACVCTGVCVCAFLQILQIPSKLHLKQELDVATKSKVLSPPDGELREYNESEHFQASEKLKISKQHPNRVKEISP